MPTRDQDVFERIRKSGVRKKVAGNVADAFGKIDGRKAPKSAKKALQDFRGLVSELEDRVSGGPEKRKAAAKKAARTRKSNARERSAAAKKGARTRAKSKTK